MTWANRWRAWLKEHPRTTKYLLVVTTATFILEMIDVVF